MTVGIIAYKKEYDDIAYQHAKQGYPVESLGAKMIDPVHTPKGVLYQTILHWRDKYPSFQESWERGRLEHIQHLSEMNQAALASGDLEKCKYINNLIGKMRRCLRTGKKIDFKNTTKAAKQIVQNEYNGTSHLTVNESKMMVSALVDIHKAEQYDEVNQLIDELKEIKEKSNNEQSKAS